MLSRAPFDEQTNKCQCKCKLFFWEVVQFELMLVRLSEFIKTTKSFIPNVIQILKHIR